MRQPLVSGNAQLKFLLPGVQTAEQRFRERAAKLGIRYKIADYGGSRTPQITDDLIRWRNEAVARGEKYYRVSAFDVGKHGVDGAFDVEITDYPNTMTLDGAYRALGNIVKDPAALGLIWGGTFSAPADPFHFESWQTREQLATRSATWRADPNSPWNAGVLDAVTTAVVNATAATKKGETTFAIVGALAILGLLLLLLAIR